MASLVESPAARALMRRVATSTNTAAFSAVARRSWSFVELALRAVEGERGGTRVAELNDGALKPIVAAFLDAGGRSADVPSFEPSKRLPVNASLIGFLCDALAYAAAADDTGVARLALSPYAGLDPDEARTLLVTVRDREAVTAAFTQPRVPLSLEAQVEVARFAAALGLLTEAFRAQGIGARDMVTTIARTFRLEDFDDEGERAGLALAYACADALDGARRATTDDWEARELVDLIDDALNSAPRTEDEVSDAAPLAPRAPEEPSPIERRAGHFSPSALGAYAECERKWYYRYVCAAVEDRGSSASAYGSAFHAALEAFHGAYPRADAAPLTEMASRLDAYLIEAFERYRGGFRTTVEFELQKRRARRTASRYLRWFVERFRRQPFTVIGQEAAAELELDGYRFVGYIDRIDREDGTGNVAVIDYKTGSIATSAAEYRARVADLLDFQLPFYYWERTARGDRVTRLALVPLKDAHLDVRPIELEVVPVPTSPARPYDPSGLIGIDELERARAEMIRVARRLSGEVIERFAPTDDADACVYCAYRNACRSRPRRHEDRFGR